MKKIKSVLIALICLFVCSSAFSQNAEKMNILESRHKFFSMVQSANMFLETIWDSYRRDKEHVIVYKDYDEYAQAHAVVQGHCENGVILSTALIKIEDNLIYVLTAGTVEGMDKNEIKLMLSTISDGDTKVLIDGIYQKERYKAGVNLFLEIVNFDTGSWGSNFYVMLEDYYNLSAFCLPNVATPNGENLRVFEVSKYFNPCNE